MLKLQNLKYLTLFLLVQIVLFIPPWLYTQEKQTLLEQSETRSLSNAYQISVGSYENISKLLYSEIINVPEVLHWVALANSLANTEDVRQQNYARAQLLATLSKTYQALKSFGLKQLHFHLPDGTSLLRFHRPNKFGDKLFDVRYSIKQANTLKEPVYGFEEGRIYNGFRYVFPLFYENKHIGSVETSVGFPAIEQSMKQVLPEEFMMLLDKQVVMGKVFSSEQSNYQSVALSPYYVEETSSSQKHAMIPAKQLAQINQQLAEQVSEKLLAKQSFIASTVVDNKPYLATFVPLYNVKKEAVGYLVSYAEDDRLMALNHSLYLRYAGLTLINLLGFAYFLLLIKSKARISLQNEHLNQLNQEKNEFMGIVVHDLKNPLSSIMGYAEFLQEDAEFMDVETIKDYAGNIEHSSVHMFQLITNLLDVNAIESGKLNTTFEEVELAPIVAESVTQYQERAESKQIKLTLSLKQCCLVTDKLLFQQVMDNLISNAIKYSPHHSQVQVYMQRRNNKLLCIVEDQGPGLSPADQSKLFGKFVRLSPRPTDGEHSTGLGLFIVKKLADTLQAQIRCESELGKGSRFILELPCLHTTV